MKRGDAVIVQDGSYQFRSVVVCFDQRLVGLWVDGEWRWINRQNVWPIPSVQHMAFYKPDDGEDSR